MGFLSALFKGGMALHQGEAVKEQNRELEQRLQQDPRSLLEGAKRFTFAQKYLHANLQYRVRSLPFHSYEERRRYYCLYLQELSREFHMAKQDLDRITATKADVAALGMAIKAQNLEFDQLAQHIDEQVQALGRRDVYLQSLQTRNRWLLALVLCSLLLSVVSLGSLALVIFKPERLPASLQRAMTANLKVRSVVKADKEKRRKHRRRNRLQRTVHSAKVRRRNKLVRKHTSGLTLLAGKGVSTKLRRLRRLRLFAGPTLSSRTRRVVTNRDTLKVLTYSREIVCTRKRAGRRSSSSPLRRCRSLSRQGRLFRCLEGKDTGRTFAFSTKQWRKWLICWGVAVQVQVVSSSRATVQKQTGWLPGYYLTRYR